MIDYSNIIDFTTKKLTERRDICIGILFENGYSAKDILTIVGLKNLKDVVVAIRKQGVTVKKDKPTRFELLSADEQDMLEFSEYRTALNRVHSLLTESKKELDSNTPKELKDVETPLKEFEEVEALEDLTEFEKMRYADTHGIDILEVQRKKIKALCAIPDYNNICSACENTGVVTIRTNSRFQTKTYVCPKCKGSSTKRIPLDKLKLDPKGLQKLIPNEVYLTTDYSRSLLEELAPIPQDLKGFMFDNYLDSLEYVLSYFNTGKLPTKSFLISAPDGFGKKHFIYEAIKNCVLHSINSTELLEMSELQALLSENKFSELNRKLEKEVIFVSVSGSIRKLETDVFKYLLDFCERKGIPAIIISRYDAYQLAKQHSNYNKDLQLDWLDIFQTIDLDRDFGHLKNIGVTGEFAREIFKYKSINIESLLNNSPANYKNKNN